MQLRVRDTGVGLPQDLALERAKSLGLGLRLVHILARRLAASVQVESREGTCFTLTFPRYADPPREPSAT